MLLCNQNIALKKERRREMEALLRKPSLGAERKVKNSTIIIKKKIKEIQCDKPPSLLPPPTVWFEAETRQLVSTGK